jgi:hypothetical protein
MKNFLERCPMKVFLEISEALKDTDMIDALIVDDMDLEIVASRILAKHIKAFEELAK